MKKIIKIVIDILMSVILILLPAYSLVGEAAHEWLGMGIFALFILHHILNNRWLGNVFKGKYTPFRIWQTGLVFLCLASMMGSAISGIVISRHALAFLPIHSGTSWARTLHILSGYWGFVFISLHIGLHWSMMMNGMKKMFKKPSEVRSRIIRIFGWIIVGYGVYAFIKRDIGSYMFLKTQFVFFNFEEPLIFFLLDYTAVMGLFVFIGHYLSGVLKKSGGNKKSTER
ncbi:MAG: DUF4405 domain-containing protein [Oscillospiraceae bacterium]|nr:DUF4405 domain-containing protein [Oscillospiraceae bacterium]